jgi:hypothetical protein
MVGSNSITFHPPKATKKEFQNSPMFPPNTQSTSSPKFRSIISCLDLSHVVKTAHPVSSRTLPEDAVAPGLGRNHLAVGQLPRGDAVVECRGHEVDLDEFGVTVDLVRGPGLVVLLHILVERGLGARRVDLLVGLAEDGVLGDVLAHDLCLFGSEGAPKQS